MTISPHIAMPRHAARLALVGMTMLATVHGAVAEDGLTGFLSAVFGGGTPQPAATPAPAQVSTPSRYHYVPRFRMSARDPRRFQVRAITVHLHKPAPKVLVAQIPSKPGVVSIFEDRTLKRGDAVMTEDGIRVFAGSASWPYTKADFIGLAEAKDLSKDTSKVLAEVDRLPRG